MEGNSNNSATKQENNKLIVVSYYKCVRSYTVDHDLMLIEYSDDNEECRTVVG